MRVNSGREAYQANALGYVLLEREAENVVVVWDEVQRIRTGKDIPYYFRQLLDEGRHRDTWVWAIARRPVNTPVLIRSIAEEVFTFRLHSKNDISLMEDYFSEAAPAIRHLPKYHYFTYADETGIIEYRDDKGQVIWAGDDPATAKDMPAGGLAIE